MFNFQIIRKHPLPFNPLIWLDGSDASTMTISTTISQWRDKTCNGFNASAVGDQQPTLSSPVLNGRTSVTFGGTQIMSIPSVPLGQFTIFIVFRASSSVAILYEQSVNANSNNGCYMATDVGQTILVNRSTVQNAKDLTAGWGFGNVWRIAAVTFDGTNAGHRFFLNGLLKTMTVNFNNNPGVGQALDTLFVGARSGPTIGLNGNIAEMIVYNTALQTQYIDGVFNYLNRKWAVY